MSLVPMSDELAALPEFGVRDYLGIIQRRRVMFAAVFLLVLAVGLLVTVLSKNIYQTEAKLQVLSPARPIGFNGEENPISMMLATVQPQGVDIQGEELQSPEFQSEAMRQAKLSTARHEQRPTIRVEPVEDINILRILVQGGNPVETVRVADAVVDLHLRRMDLVTTAGLRGTIDFVRKEKAKAERVLEAGERRLVLIRQAHRGVELSTERQARSGEYDALQAKLLETETHSNTLRAEIRNLRSEVAMHPANLVQETTRESPVARKLADKLEDVKIQRMELLRSFRPTSREVQDLTDRSRSSNNTWRPSPRRSRFALPLRTRSDSASSAN